METSPAVFQLRVDPGLGRRLKDQAKRERISANRLMAKAIDQYLRQVRDREWRAGFEAMARDADTNDVAYAFDAAREVVLGE